MDSSSRLHNLNLTPGREMGMEKGLKGGGEYEKWQRNSKEKQRWDRLSV